MNKFLKVMLIGSGVIALIGLIFVIVGFAFGAKLGLRFGDNGINVINSKEEKISDMNLNEFQNIDMKVSYGDVEFVESDSFGIEIRYHDNSNTPTYEVKDNTLSINVTGSENGRNGFFSFINLNFSDYDNKIIVYLPKDYKLNTVTINNNLGDVKVTDVTVSTLDLTLDCGDVKLNTITADKITVKDSLGDINGENVTATNTSLYNSCGDITIKGNLTGSIDVTDQLGDCEISLAGSQGDYNLKLNTSLGNVKIADNKMGNNYTNQINVSNSVTVNNSCGDIDVDFNN